MDAILRALYELLRPFGGFLAPLSRSTGITFMLLGAIGAFG